MDSTSNIVNSAFGPDHGGKDAGDISLSSGPVKKPRINTACLSCRKRKSKCNGATPCSNCVHYGKQCLYPSMKSQRKRGKGKLNNFQEIHHINQRLNVLEDILVRLSNHLDSNLADSSLRKESIDTTTSDETVGVSPGVIPVETDSSQKSYDSNHGSPDSIVTAVNLVPEKTEKEYKLPCLSSVQSWLKQPHLFAGFNHLKSPLRPDIYKWKYCDESIIRPLKRLPEVFGTLVRATAQKWLHPPSKDVVANAGKYGHFPADAQLVNEILDAYYSQHCWLLYVAERDHVKHLFSLYYSRKGHQFKYSELLMMNYCLALCLVTRSYYEEDAALRGKFPKLKSLDEPQLYDLQNQFFNTGLCYYENVSIQNEGLLSVQCLIYMIIYIQVKLISDFHINLILSALLVLYAQDLGLNRINDQKQIISPKEYTQCKRLWWFCECLDVVSCFKSGRSCFLSSNDVASVELAKEDINYLRVGLNVQKHIIDGYKNPVPFTDVFAEFYSHYASISLKRIQRETYDLMLSAKAQHENRDPKVFFKRYNRILSVLDNLSLELDPKYRIELPWQNFNDSYRINPLIAPLYDNKDPNLSLCNYMFRLDYLSHYALVCQIPSLYHRGNEISDQAMEKSIVVSRTILQLAQATDPQKLSRFVLTWTTQHIYIGFITLLTRCLIFPNDPETEQECKLLVQVALSYFYSAKSAKHFSNFADVARYEQKLCIGDIITRVVLKFLLSILSSEWKRDLIQEFKLYDYFHQIELVCPNLFVGTVESTRLEPRLSNIINNDSNEELTPSNPLLDSLRNMRPSIEENADTLPIQLFPPVFNIPRYFYDL